MEANVKKQKKTNKKIKNWLQKESGVLFSSKPYLQAAS